MAKNILAAQVNTSIMEGTESTFSVDVKDYLGESVDISLITLRCSLSNGTACEIAWNAELGVHELTIPELTEGSYEYEIDELLDTGETVALVTGVIGVFNRDNWQEPVLSTTSPNRTLRIVKADEKGQIEATWLATSAAAGYAYESKKNADVLKDAMPLILQAAEFMKSFDEALRQAIKVENGYLLIGGINTGYKLKGEDGKDGVTPRYGADGYWYIGDECVGKARGDDGITPHITSTGYWAIGGVVTNVRAVGRDGLDGTAVRMILVDSYDDIPQSGETCNGGFRYLVRRDGWAMIGDPAAATGTGEWEAWEMPSYLLPSEFTHLRVPGALNQNSTPVYLMVRTTAGKVLGVSQNTATWAVGDVVTWEFAEAVRVSDGEVVQMFLRKTNEGETGVVPNDNVRMKSLLANEGVCRLRYLSTWHSPRTPYLLAWGAGAGQFYDVYAWVERAEAAGWVRVDRTNELATSRVYGVMKYATDEQVDNGAPVGQNADGQASVPLASTSVAGVGKIGDEYPVQEGAGVYIRFDENYNYVIPKAGINTYGVVKTSYTLTVTKGGLVGTNTDGNLMVRPASTTWYGTVILGEQYAHDNPEPYMFHVGSTAGNDPRMVIAQVYGGAIQARRSGAWQGCMTWLDEQMNAHEEYFGNSVYLGLLHTEQFSQSSGSGLELLPATTQRLAGVYLASSMTDNRAAAVLTSDVVVNYLNEHYYEKSVVYTKQETLTQIEYKLQTYATISWVSDNFMTRSQIMAELDKKLGCPSGRARNIEFLTASERESLSSIDKKMAYLVYAG